MTKLLLVMLFSIAVSACGGGGGSPASQTNTQTTNYTGTWIATGSLATARRDHTATLLANGKVLVAGGLNGNVNLASAELYDPATGNWSATGSLATARAEHTATLLPNGKVLVAGGDGAGQLASAELYDPATGLWTATGSLAAQRVFHTATLLPNGKVLVSGGVDYSLSTQGLVSSELYDPATGIWTATGNLTIARYYHGATLLPSGKVLVTGGCGGGNGGCSKATAELYDPATGLWTATGSLATGRDYPPLTLLPNGKVLVSGGLTQAGALASAELYDPATGTWTVTGSLATARSTTATLLTNGKVLVTGGMSGGSISTVFASAELYDPATGIWTATGSLATARVQHTATLLANGKVLVTGGTNDVTNWTTALASSELYQ